MEMDAGISSCKKYRWWLWRRWSDLPLVIWIMMNPSTADHTKNDPTIFKIIRYSTRWGYGAALILNVYAYRTSRQENLPQSMREALGRSNRWWIRTIMKFAKQKNLKIICAWGAKHHSAGMLVRYQAARLRVKLHCLELSLEGEPKHPLYLKESLDPIRFV